MGLPRLSRWKVNRNPQGSENWGRWRKKERRKKKQWSQMQEPVIADSCLFPVSYSSIHSLFLSLSLSLSLTFHLSLLLFPLTTYSSFVPRFFKYSSWGSTRYPIPGCHAQVDSWRVQVVDGVITSLVLGRDIADGLEFEYIAYVLFFVDA